VKFRLEALQANDGDCLLLHYQRDGVAKPTRVLIDGGSNGVYLSILKKHIDRLRGEEPFDLRMAMVSHIDADHITGMLDLFRALEKQQDDGEDRFCSIATLWHNSFEKLHGGKKAVAQSAAVTASLDGVVPPNGLDEFVAAVVASVAQGNQLRRLAVQLGIPINDGGGDDVISAPEHGKKVVKIADGLTFTVLLPSAVQLKRLGTEFEKARDRNGADDAALAADYLNNTVPNMSSIVVMAEAARSGRKKPLRMLLTGDARGDIIIDGLERAGFMDRGQCHVDLLKVQHHGSNHSVTQDFFERVTADRYVISGNGKHGIPHKDALQFLSAARHKQPYEVFMTNRTGVLGLKKTLDAFITSETKNERSHVYHFRKERDLAISVDLA
jgi:beta-lactamase superfamily II metal-dependent hydrolase